MNQINIMDFEHNPINKAAWKYLNEAKAAIKDNSKILMSLDIPVLGELLPHSITDEKFIERMTHPEVNKSTRMEALQRLMMELSEEERAVMTIFLFNNVNIDNLSDLGCLELHNKIIKRFNN